MKKNMEQANYLKAIVIGIGSFLTSILGVLAIPTVLMVASNVTDYITGLIASKFREQDINSYRSMRGIFKKVGMWLLVIVGAILDVLLEYSLANLGIQIPFSFPVASIVEVWITCNEIISNLENIQDIGVNIPGFLKPLVKNIRSQVEHQADILQEDQENSPAV